jgi:3-phenylpropionate/trans-cinnamate dioxygenase ferredoxin subunit
MSDFVRVCSLAELPDEDSAIHVDAGGVPVAIVHAGGDYYAIHDVCSHADVPLSEGDVDGCTIECWLHGSRFDLRTGKPTGLPAIKPVPVYALRLQGDDVLVSLTTSPDSLTNASSQEPTA